MSAKRYAIFGDIHSNLEALQAVVADAAHQQCTDYACLGDSVGYYFNPKECLEIVRDLACPVVKGNHDELASLDPRQFPIPANPSPLANEGLDFTRAAITAADRQWLASLPLARQIDDFTIVHATLDTPHKWGYVLNALDAGASFSYQHTQLCFFGHTHRPCAYQRTDRVRVLAEWETVQLEPGAKYLLNVGSVGQPRDGDPRASYAIYHAAERRVELRRVDYDRGLFQGKFPPPPTPQNPPAARVHADRSSHGP